MDWNFNQCANIVLAFEGGYSCDRNDRGNWTGGAVGVGHLRGTKFGISAAAYPNTDIKALTVYAAAALLKNGYWTYLHCDTLPLGMDLCAFNAGVNCGPGRASNWLTRAKNDIHTFEDIDYAFHRGLAQWKLYGAGWSRRIEIVKNDALIMRNSAGTKMKIPDLANYGDEFQAIAPKAEYQKLKWGPWILERLGTFPLTTDREIMKESL